MKSRFNHVSSLCLLLFAVVPAGGLKAEEAAEGTPSEDGGRAQLGGPTSVQAELREDRVDVEQSGLDQWNAWKQTVQDRYGLQFSMEYSWLGQTMSSSAISERSFAGGLARLFGSWELFGRNTDNPGSLVFRVDNRHRYTDFDPQGGSIAAGSALPTGALFSGREWGLVNLQWSQMILDGKGAIVFGMTPADDYFHAYGLASPLTAFSNLAFSTGGVAAIPDTGLGLAFGSMLDDHWYVKGGVHDANGSSSDPNLDVFGDWELYKNFEIGWTPARDKLYLQNLHLGVWHADERSEVGVPESWGVVANASWYFENTRIMPFIRGGWSDGKAALLNAQVSAGVGKQVRERDLLGLGVSWGDPSATGSRDQWSSELFYRIQLRNLAITPSVQMLVNPATHPDQNSVIIGGLRGRIVF